MRAYDADGNLGLASRSFIVNNVATPSETIPRHYNHIRVAMLAYSGTPMTSVEQGLLQNSVDLVIPNEQYLSDIQAASPTTPQLIYTNVSNMYSGLLTDWLNYADRNGLSRESAFYHLSQATGFAGGSPSSQPVNWLWDVRRESTNLTFASHDTGAADIAFGSAGQSLSSRATPIVSANSTSPWPAALPADGPGLEYATAVDANGAPTAWQLLMPRTEGTNGFRQSGRITFDPPINWVTAKLNGSASLYYVRCAR